MQNLGCKLYKRVDGILPELPLTALLLPKTPFGLKEEKGFVVVLLGFDDSTACACVVGSGSSVTKRLPSPPPLVVGFGALGSSYIVSWIRSGRDLEPRFFSTKLSEN